LSPSLRLGVATGVAYTSYSNSSTVSGAASVSGQPAQMLSTVRASGHQFHLVETVGLQWDAGRGFTVGAVLRSPGVSIDRGSLVTYQATFTRSTAPPLPISASFRDGNGAFQYKLPFEASAGLAYRFGRAQVELDVRYHHNPGDYSLYRSDNQVQVTTFNPDGSTTPSTQRFPALDYSGRSVVNLAAGGTYQATEALTLHVGAFNSMSPISDANSSAFRKANLFGATAGVAFTGTHFSVSLGAACQFGHSDPVPLPELNGSESALDILSLTILYALAYEF
jgi:hypothetical protein